MLSKDFEMISLDWDKINYTEAARRINFILNEYSVIGLELRTSPRLDGFHVYVETSTENPVRVRRLRRSWKDDPIRLVKDLLSDRRILRNVMFVYKCSPLGRLNETPIIKYYRDSRSNEWKWQSLRRNQSQTSSPDLPSSLVSLKALSTESQAK